MADYLFPSFSLKLVFYSQDAETIQVSTNDGQKKMDEDNVYI